MSFAFKNSEELYASDYIERKKALNNYQYFQKRFDTSINPSNIISNYDGTVYFIKDNVSSTSSNAKYYLANSRSYEHLLSITKGGYLLSTSYSKNNIDASCILCSDISHNLNGELYEGNYYSIKMDVDVSYISVSNNNHGLEDINIISITYSDKSKNVCDINLYNTYINSDGIHFNDLSYIEKKYSFSLFKFPSRLQR